jgi:hypothetical protein
MAFQVFIMISLFDEIRNPCFAETIHTTARNQHPVFSMFFRLWHTKPPTGQQLARPLRRESRAA